MEPVKGLPGDYQVNRACRRSGRLGSSPDAREMGVVLEQPLCRRPHFVIGLDTVDGVPVCQEFLREYN